MVHDNTPSFPKLTAYDFELALEQAEASGEHKVGAFNKAEFAKNLAKLAPAIFAFAAAAGLPIPAGTPAAIGMVIEAAKLILNHGNGDAQPAPL